SMASRMPRRPAARALRADPAQAGGTRRATLLRHRVHAGAQRRAAAMEDRRHRAGERLAGDRRVGHASRPRASGADARRPNDTAAAPRAAARSHAARERQRMTATRRCARKHAATIDAIMASLRASLPCRPPSTLSSHR
ncbi:hypothetical protein, partial [Burkholderia pseudomallei]|uniref:hypothetical protein n=1 Tax=Burkholderia pseudomallei TaxID=28450 RepID=UPI001A900B67